MNELKIEYLDVNLLTPYENNARAHGKKDIEAIDASIGDFGFNDPIGIWGENNIIVEGHGRLMAAKQRGINSVPCIRLDHLTDEQRRAYALAHNRTAEMSSWDEMMKKAEIKNIKAIDMSKFGFKLQTVSPEANESEFDETAFEEIPINRGEVFALGEHRLMCGDSANADEVKKLMGGGKADMVFTDPPYGVAIGDKNAVLNSITKGRITQNIENDTLSEKELYELLKTAFINVRENCADDAVYYVTAPQGGSLYMMMMMMMKEAGLPVRHVLIWRKNVSTFSLGRLDYDYQHEPIFYTWTKSHHNYRRSKNRTSIWDYDKPQKSNLHPTMKPVELVADAILDGTEEGMTVLDAFGGSGTTLIACEETRRICRMMELDPHYCGVIIRRWEELTGKKAERIEP